MKKLIIAAVLTLLFSVQGYNQRMFNIGFKAGVNMQSPSFDDASSIKSLKENYWGYNLGISTRFKFSFVSIQPEFIFSQSSTQMKIDDSGVDDIVTGKFSNITIPVMVNFHFLKILHAGLGPTYTFQFPSFEGGGNHWNDLKDNFNAGSFGVQFGLGVDIWRLYIDVNYQVGIGRYKSSLDLGGKTYEINARPNTLWLTVGFWFLNPKKK